jgi:endonuclease-8
LAIVVGGITGLRKRFTGAMPEGPEIRRAAERIARKVVGREAEQVEFSLPRLASWGDELSGRVVEAVDVRGKAMLTRFEGDLAVYSHNQLYGVWFVRQRYDLPSTGRQLRLAIHTERHSALLYSASEIEVLTREEEAAHPFLAALGPDPLNDDLAPGDLARRFAAPRFRRRQLGALLLDQRCVAGLGNYLRADILFDAGIHPARRPADCADAELMRLDDAVRCITRRSFDTGGLTVEPELAERLKASGEPRRRFRHWVYGRAGDVCRRCGAEIAADAIGGRKMYLCPVCQPRHGGVDEPWDDC